MAALKEKERVISEKWHWLAEKALDHHDKRRN